MDPGKHPETLYGPSYVIGLHFTKSQKNRIFHFKNHGKKFFEADFSGRCGPATKPILGIDTSYWCPQSLIILMHAPQPFLLICIIKNWAKSSKFGLFHESVVSVAFVAFWVLLMLFFKISKVRRCCYLFLFFLYDV